MFFKDSNTSWVTAPGSFLFSLRNHDNLPPFQALLKDENLDVIYRSERCGPVFCWDLRICDIATSHAYSYTNLGDCFQTPRGYAFSETKTQNLLAGSYFFIPAEVEVLYMN